MSTRKNRFGFVKREGTFPESKRNPSQQQKQVKKFDNLKVEEPQYLKSYICPKCNNFYDFQLTSYNVYVGRVPLLLNCLHTVCEECILLSVPKQRVECVECNVITCFDTEGSKRSVQDEFPVNFYVFGLVSYYRRSRLAMPNLSFRSISLEDKKPEQGINEAIFCSRVTCPRGADLNCFDCDEAFCTDCADAIHGSNGTLSGHDLVKLGNVTPELRQNCQTHRGSVLEFACRPCDVNLCCYCVLSSHKDHDYYQLTEMTDEDVTKITNLVLEAENSLRYLKRTDKKISEYLNQSTDTPKSNLDTEISKLFETFHAKLQATEKRLHAEVNDHRQSRQKTLVSIRGKINQNITFINRFCHYAKQLLNKEDVKYNIGYIVETLTAASKVKCHLLRQEVSDDLQLEYSINPMDDIDSCYTIKYDKKSEFLLVKTEDLPEDFESSSSLDSSMNQSNDVSFTNEDYTEDDESNKNTPLLVKSDESISSDQKSVMSGTTLSWADECLILEEELKKRDESISELEVGHKQRVTVTHINSPSSFYVHLAKSKNLSAKLSKDIAKYAMSSCVKVEPEINQIYLVKFNDGSFTQWYRGRVINFDQNKNKYTVFFIDYGNTSIVPKNWIRNIPLDLIKIPPLAIECKIHDLWPYGTSWNKSALAPMADIVNKQSLLMVVFDKSFSTYSVDLATLDGSTSVRDALIFSGFGVPLQSPDSLITETKREMASFTSKKEIHKFSRKFAENETVDVLITNAENPFKIHLILVEFQRILNDVKLAMNQFYKGAKKGLVYSLEVGMHVAVNYKLGKDVSWYRATVVEVPETRGSIKVELIDVGPTVVVRWENVRKLDDKFYATESLSFCVEMMDVEPFGGSPVWPEAVGEFFRPYIVNKTILTMIVHSQNPLAAVFLQDMETYKACVNALLVSKSYGTAVGKYAMDIKWKSSEDKSNFTTEMLKTIQSSGSIHDESYDDDYSGIQKEVEIVSAENPSLIYVRFLDIKARYDELYEQLQNCYANCEFVPRQWSPKQPVVVMYNGEYLRGIVEAEVSSDVYKVNLKDVRKEIEVNSSNMTQLHPSFTKCPELITRCHLANIIPAGGSEKWTAIACELLQETLKDKLKIFLTKCGKIDMTTRSLPVLLWYKQFIPGGPLEQSKTILCSVNKILLKNGVALKENVKEIFQKEFVRETSFEKKYWDWLPPTLITDDRITALPTYVNDHGYIYIHDKRDEEQLEEMSATLMRHFENSSVDNKLEDWRVGDICIAKYFLNEQWYRAKVVEVNEDSVSVIMVDYGNEEDLKPHELRKEILFDNKPVFASVVYLQGVNPLNGVWHTTDLDIVHGAIVDKEIDVYFINGHDNHNPSPVHMSCKTISINEFLLTKCEHLENSKKNNDEMINIEKTSMGYEEDVLSDYESDGESDVLILDDEKSEIQSTESLLNYKIESLPTHEDIEIVIINLLHYNVIVFELTNYENVNLDTFDKMQAEIRAEAPQLPVLADASLDAPCIVKYSQDNSYYRGKILGLRNDEVFVWFVDYGNFEFIPKAEVKEIRPQWLEYSVQHHIAEIDGIELVDEDKENIIKEHLASFYTTMLVANVVSQEPLKVRLYDMKTHKLIYQEFIDDGTLRLVDK